MSSNFDEVNSSMRGRQQLTSTQKKEILWNIIQPGDPYDIKKYRANNLDP